MLNLLRLHVFHKLILHHIILRYKDNHSELYQISTEHPDTTNIYKCNVQFDATWTTQDIDGSGTEDNVYLSQFGGVLTGSDNRATGQPGDYVIISRPSNGSDGEIFELKTTLDQVAKKFSVKNGCDTNSENTVFEVDSVTGDIIINNSTTTVNGTLNLVGACGGTAVYTQVLIALMITLTLKIVLAQYLI